MSFQAISKYIADENFQTYTDQNHTAQYLRFACQLYSEFTANEQPSNTDKKCDSCNDQGTDQSHQPVIFTDLSNDELYEESSKPYDFQIDGNSSEPQILIYHTHATESFEPTDKDHYDSSFSCKTTDPEMNMLSVGDKICEQLDKAGVAYIHDTLVHDYPSYDGSYDSSRMAVKQILEEYPSIKVCLDVHRDGIEREDGTRLAPVAEIEGREAAQLMIISGCDDGTMGMPDYMKNFHFACALQSALESDWQGLTRPVLFDYRHYNQDLTTGSLLIEVGSHGNSITQAQYTGELIGKTLGEMFGGE